MGRKTEEYRQPIHRFPLLMAMNVIGYVDCLPVFSNKPPSEEFLSALSAAGGPDSAVCEFCHRRFVSQDCDEENLPSGPFIRQPVSSLTIGYLENRCFVFDCPCNAAHLYELLFWQHLPIIAPYSQTRALLQLKRAEDKVALANSVVVPK